MQKLLITDLVCRTALGFQVSGHHVPCEKPGESFESRLANQIARSASRGELSAMPLKQQSKNRRLGSGKAGSSES
jgi:hypothetical protein